MSGSWAVVACVVIVIAAYYIAHGISWLVRRACDFVYRKWKYRVP